MQFDENGELLLQENGEVIHVLSYDEKPGIQTVANTSEDILLGAHHSGISRDYEYKRLGTVSLFAGIDLQTGETIPLVSETHNSRDYIEFHWKYKLDDITASKTLASGTVRRRISNVDFYINEYLPYEDALTFEHGMSEVYAGTWKNQKGGL